MCELIEILQEPPPWQYTVVVISCLVSRATISSWEGTNSLALVFFSDSLMKWANISISVPGNSSLILKRHQEQYICEPGCVDCVKMNALSCQKAQCTFWDETWGSVKCLCWVRRCSSCMSGDASGHDSQDCWGVGHDWFAWSAGSKPRPLVTSSLDKSVEFLGWLAQGLTLPPSPVESWRSSQPHPAGWCNPFPFALEDRKEICQILTQNLFYKLVNPWVLICLQFSSDWPMECY